MLLQRNGLSFHLVYIIVAGYKLQLTAVLKDFHDLALELTLPYLVHQQLSVGSVLHTGKEVEATHPDGVLAVAIYDGDTTDVRSVNHTPPGTVVIEQTLEIGHIHRAVLASLYVIATVMPAIFCHRIVADKGKTLCHCVASEK